MKQIKNINYVIPIAKLVIPEEMVIKIIALLVKTI